jgi:MoxR-like ATPase
LPDAQLDRFLLHIQLSPPTAPEEREVLNRALQAEPPGLTSLLTAENILELQQASKAVYVDPTHQHHIVGWVQATRQHPKLRVGASPRGSLAVLRSSQAHALMHQRDFVTVEDLFACMENCLRHRIMLTYDARLEGLTPDDVLRDIRLSQPLASI